VFKKIIIIVVVIISAFCVWNCSVIVYGIRQGVGQLRIVNNARPIAEVMADSTFPDSLKPKLLLIQEIRKFAVDSLGINESDNYTEVYDQKGKPAMYVVTACDPYEMKPYEWHFSFLGKFTYKGFFSKERAQIEEESLKEMGLDTELGTAKAWSTLGWFKDPILSEILKDEPGKITRLIIHELTHGTLYIKDSVEYNENLATFVGDQGAVLFLKYKYGVESKEMSDYIGHIGDIEKYSNHVLKGLELLQNLFASNSFKQLDTTTKNQQKNKLIHEILMNADTITFYDKAKFKKVLSPDFTANNTFFLTYMMYREEQNVFEEEFRTKFNSDFKKYLAYLKGRYSSL
jgi:predicted aminopeptidase